MEKKDADRSRVAIERDKKKKEHLIKMRSEEARAKKHIIECFSTPAGKQTLLFLMRECGFHQPSVVVDGATQEVKQQATVYNEARRSVYLRIRSYMMDRPDVLTDVEINQMRGE